MKINNLILVLILFPFLLISQNNETEVQKDTLHKIKEAYKQEYPVVLGVDTLFYINSQVNDYPAEIRAMDISKRLALITEDYVILSAFVFG
ncbi:MAG: hypothetical protein IMY67_10190 [Bacteroidetes bacterium]|nr:hypothetical protein [Bacteroidota bacterium]